MPGTVTVLPFTVQLALPLSWPLARAVPYVMFTGLTLTTVGVAWATFTVAVDEAVV